MTTAESVESRPVSVGAPSPRNLARAAIEAVAFTACFGLASALVRPDWAPVYPAVMVAALLIAWSVAYLVTSEVVVAPGIVETRGWLRMGRHVRRQTILVSRDQPLVRMPDGRWWLGGRTVGLNVPRWETTRLVDVLTGAGIAIIDTQTAWRRSHRRRIWAYRVSWAAWLCGLWAISPSPWATTSCRSSSAWRSCWPV